MVLFDLTFHSTEVRVLGYKRTTSTFWRPPMALLLSNAEPHGCPPTPDPDVSPGQAKIEAVSLHLLVLATKLLDESPSKDVQYWALALLHSFIMDARCVSPCICDCA